MAAAGNKREKATIVIKKEEVVEGGHHGGAWKVAYADFVTAMMAFFLLMWLLNATTQAQRDGLADYFSPNNVLSSNRSGFGKPFGGTTPNVDGSLVSDKGAVRVVNARPRPYVDAADEGDGPSAEERTAGTTEEPGAGTGKGEAARPYRLPARPGTVAMGQPVSAPPATTPSPADAKPDAKAAAGHADHAPPSPAAQERAAFEHAAQQIHDQVRADPALAGLGGQIAVDITPEGLRIQILDSENRPMFATGSATPNEWSRTVLAKVTPALLRMPEPVSVAGYTDAQPYRGGDRTNWDLSADRANATRRMLAEAGLPDSRLQSVAGHADRDLLLPAEPLAAANRRVAITVLRQVPPAPAAPRPAAPQSGASGGASGSASGAAAEAAAGDTSDAAAR
jgi:chemotaxis protein MotB